jgi:predicted nucleic acid-binding protein
MVVVDIRGEDATQMALVEDYDVVEALAANRTYDALDVYVLRR